MPMTLRALAIAVTLATAPSVASTAGRFTTDTFPSTYTPHLSAPILISNATVLDGTGKRLENTDVLLREGRIDAVGNNLQLPAGAQHVDGRGKWVTPGIIDVHSHLGVYPSPGVQAHSDGNEMTNPNTGHVWAEHSVWPQDPGFAAALAGGVTSLQILPGSANLVGGRSITLKNVPATTMQAMKFPDAPYGVKMACGENPKRVYGGKGGPATRMGNLAGHRAAFIDAADYARKMPAADGSKSRKNAGGNSPKRDLKLETLAGVLEGEIIAHIHCYRADEMTNMLDLAEEFGFRIGTFHHGIEAYKIADTLAEKNVCAALWADWWGFKMEAYDGIQENIALVDRVANSCVIVHSDSDEGIQRLNQEAAKVMANARRAGMDIAPERAITWLTSNAARSLGVADRVGTLETGKMADVVVWNGTPFSSYALAEKVYVDGSLLYDRNDRNHQPISDFRLGQEAAR